jgi:exodeoxyribonuclease V alpha subunit
MPDLEPVAMDSALAMDTDHWAFVPADHPDRSGAVLGAWAACHYLSGSSDGASHFREDVRAAARCDLADSAEGTALIDRLFTDINRARILTLVRNGDQGCLGINTLIGQLLRRELDPQAPPLQPMFSGQMIIITKNDYAKDLYNGDVGIILKDVSGLYQAFFRRSDRVVRFPVDQLPAFEAAFAMTVHKSQGSEFDDVLLVLPRDPDHRLLTREIVYTGMTRAKHRFILHGTQAALETAVSRRIERQSGLRW